MEEITNPAVSTLATGNHLIAKQMEAHAGDLLPKHLATIESLLYILEGEAILYIKEREEHLKQGHTFVIPPKEIHQIKAITNFKALHFMPKTIKFKFFND